MIPFRPCFISQHVRVLSASNHQGDNLSERPIESCPKIFRETTSSKKYINIPTPLYLSSEFIYSRNNDQP